MLSPRIILAQSSSTVWMDQDSFALGYEVLSSQDHLQAGDHFSVRLHLKTGETSAYQGVSFQILLCSSAAPEATLPYSLPNNSELGHSAQLESDYQYDASASVAQLDVSRPGFEPGHCEGSIATLHLVATSNLTPVEAVVALQGGLIPIENIDLRLAAPRGIQEEKLRPSVQAYPNPFSDQLILQSPNQEVLNYQIYDLSGSIQLNGHQEPGQQIETQVLDPGIYILQLKGDKTPAQQLRLLKQ